MSQESRAAFARAVRAEPVELDLACLLIGAEVDPQLNAADGIARLDSLAEHVDLADFAVPAIRSVLRGFAGDADSYRDLRSSLLHEVLRRRTGLPILLSVVWLEVARRCGIAADGIGLPGHFIVRVDEQYVDPFSGGRTVDVDGVAPEHLRAWAGDEILLRILTNIRVWAQQSPGRIRERLWAVELSLLLPHHPAELRRERGTLLVRSGQFLAGAGDLEAYAEVVADTDPAVAGRILAEARAARARLN